MNISFQAYAGTTGIQEASQMFRPGKLASGPLPVADGELVNHSLGYAEPPAAAFDNSRQHLESPENSRLSSAAPDGPNAPNAPGFGVFYF